MLAFDQVVAFTTEERLESYFLGGNYIHLILTLCAVPLLKLPRWNLEQYLFSYKPFYKSLVVTMEENTIT